MAKAKALSVWKANLRRDWSELAINNVQIQVNNGQDGEQLNLRQPQLKVGAELNVNALVKLGRINPNDVSVELYYGPVDAWGEIRNGSVIGMNYKQPTGQDSEHLFSGTLSCREAGHCGVAVRIVPKSSDLVATHEMGLILWEAPAEKSSNTPPP
jgi:starch phosphorylase